MATMNTPESAPVAPRKSWCSRLVGWFTAACWGLCRIALVGWATLVLYYSNLPWAPGRLVLAAASAFGPYGSRTGPKCVGPSPGCS